MKQFSFTLSRKDTSILKGVALLMLLAHHLFYIQSGLYDDIHLAGDHYLVQDIGIWCKMCVSIFVFLSGYGLTAGALKSDGIGNVKAFYWHRLSKLLINYWFIWLLFVPIGIFAFGQTFSETYQSPVFPKLLLDLFGIINCFGWLGYNGTWWFYSCIIVLYLAFPWLYRLMEKSLWLLLLVVFALYFIPGPYFHGSNIYFASFTMGMLVKRYEEFITVKNPWMFVLLFMLLAVERFRSNDVYIFDAVLTLSLVLAYKSISFVPIVNTVLEFLGKHSMNIFLFHTFIYYYWFEDFIYSTRNPLVIYSLLLLICIIISIVLEMIKRVIHFDKFISFVDKLYGVR